MRFGKLFPTQVFSIRINLKKYYQSNAHGIIKKKTKKQNKNKTKIKTNKQTKQQRTTAVAFPGFNNNLNKPMSNKTTERKMTN